MDKNYFDIVMAHIEENVTKPTEEIKREIPRLIGKHSRAFNESFSLLTGYTLDYYIKQRRLHYAARELIVSRAKSICDIALEYQFSDQASFSRAIKAKYKFTPGELRKYRVWPTEEPFSFRRCLGAKANTRTQRILQRLDVGSMENDEMEFWYEIDQVNESGILDTDTCVQIMDLAETLGISFAALYNYCVSEMVETQSTPGCIDPDDLRSIYAGVDSYEEETAICEYFNCEPGTLNAHMVEIYRKRHQST